jgi:hypothetical protein
VVPRRRPPGAVRHLLAAGELAAVREPRQVDKALAPVPRPNVEAEAAAA